MIKLWKNYCEQTTLHGFQYFSKSNLCLAEKIFWTFVLISAMIASSFSLKKLLNEIEKNPTIMYQSEIPKSVTDIPFPSFTYCPGMKPREKLPSLEYIENLLKMQQNGQNLTEEEEWEIYALNFYGIITNEINKNFDDYNNISIQMTRELYFFGSKSVMIDSFDYGDWMQKFELTTGYFPTKLGACFTNNMRYNDESLKIPFYETRRVAVYAGASKVDPFLKNYRRLAKYPFKTKHKDLGVDLFIYEGDGRWRESYEIYNYGFKLALHSPDEFPDETLTYRHLAINASYIINITPVMKTIDESLESLEPHERSCFLKGEKELDYYKIYTAKNCKTECLIKFILKSCGCVPLYHIYERYKTRLCQVKERKCFEDATTEFFEKLEPSCDCLQPCVQLNYEIELKQTKFVTNSKTKPTVGHNSGENFIHVSILFKDELFYPLIRKLHYTGVEIFSFVGGLLGLFLGFSVLSLFEIFYHFCLSPIMIYLRTRKINDFKEVKVAWEESEQQKITTKFQKVRHFVSNILENSSIHGLWYFVDKKLHFFERFLWIFSFFASMTGCIYMIIELHNASGINSVVTVIEDQAESVANLKFPAVTIFGAYQTTKFPEYYKNLILTKEQVKVNGIKNFEPEGKVLLLEWYMQCILSEEYAIAIYWPENANFTNYEKDMVKSLKKFSETDWFSSQEGSWNNQFKIKFAEVLTARGFGFSFNLANASDVFHDEISNDFKFVRNISLDGGMRDFSHNFPWNPTNGLDILKLNFKIPNYEEIKFYNAFMIHPPDEPPLLLDKNNLIEFDGGREFKIMIIPNVITTDEDLISFDVDDRQCYLESEKYLRFFKIYSVKNCNVECFGNYSLRTCGCVPFDVVRDDEMPICNIHAYNCTDNLKYEMKFNFNDYSDCKCYPKCSTISYDFEIIENRLRDDTQTSKIEIMFKNQDYVPLRRFRKFTIIDFLSLAGGVLGLFAGISVLSFFEIIYFLSIRLITNSIRST